MKKTYIFKRTIFLSPDSKVEGNKSLISTPDRVTFPKGATIDAVLENSTDNGIEKYILFTYQGMNFRKPYGGTDLYARLNKRDIVEVVSEVDTAIDKPERSIPIGRTENTTNTTNQTQTQKTTAKSFFTFKDKLHAGITLIGVGFGVYYAYKTKQPLVKIIGYTLGAGAIGFIVGGVASSFATTQSVKSKVEGQVSAESGKPLK
jgi:hypothetical protein